MTDRLGWLLFAAFSPCTALGVVFVGLLVFGLVKAIGQAKASQQ